MLEWAVAYHFQGLLEENDFLEPFQSGFRTGFGTETTWVDDSYQDLDG